MYGWETWELLTVPQSILAALPAETDNTQHNWDQLAREFVADIRSEGNVGYQTFRNGWIYQAVINIVRAGSGWTRLASDL